MAITTEELARMAGCSVATVSRALNNTGAVAPETREAIYRTLRETRYTPQRVRSRKKGADSLIQIIYHRHSPTETLSLSPEGFVLSPLRPVSKASLRTKSILNDSFWPGIIDGATAEIQAWGYRAILTTNIDLQDPDLMASINAPDKAGVLLVGEYSDALTPVVDLCRHPLVLADLICDDTHDLVTTDNFAGMGAAFDHLYGLGHRRIGFVGRFDANFACAERFAAFQMKMAAAGLPVRPQWVYEGYSQIEPATEGVKKILSQPDRPSAFLCSNDCVALGVLRAADALGIRVPEQLSVVGFDGTEAVSLFTPTLTTVHVPVEEIGIMAVRLLMTKTKTKSKSAGLRRGCRIRVVPELAIGQSTRRVSEAAGPDIS
jgi:LacI family transcriptional regulator